MINQAQIQPILTVNPKGSPVYAMLVALIFMLLIQNICFSQARGSNGGYGGSQLVAPIFLPADTSVTAPIDAVWMPIDTFATYYQAFNLYQDLVPVVQAYQQQVDSLKVSYERSTDLCASRLVNYDRQIDNHNEQLLLYDKELRRTRWKSRISSMSTVALITALIIIR
jgi:hypothetical protein